MAGAAEVANIHLPDPVFQLVAGATKLFYLAADELRGRSNDEQANRRQRGQDQAHHDPTGPNHPADPFARLALEESYDSVHPLEIFGLGAEDDRQLVPHGLFARLPAGVVTDQSVRRSPHSLDKRLQSVERGIDGLTVSPGSESARLPWRSPSCDADQSLSTWSSSSR